MFDVVSLGEILIDFTPSGISESGNPCFERNPGGAPANVCVAVSRLGGKAAFIGKAGDDMFGRYLCEVLKDSGVDTGGFRFNSRVNTTLAFVQLDESGERSFSFYRNPGADTTLEPDEVDLSIVGQGKVFHFGSLSLTDEPCRSSTLKALEFARNNGIMISYDPNLRPPLWKSMEHAKREIVSLLEYPYILKVSEEELEFITGTANLEAATKYLYDEYNTGVILVTLGDKGCFYRLGNSTGKAGTFNSVKRVDTTGAGDAFLGGFLYYITNLYSGDPKEIKAEILEKALVFANATASLCVTRKGAIPAMPTLEKVKELVSSGTKG